MRPQQNKVDDILKVDFQQAMTLLSISWNTRRAMLIVGPPATAKSAVVDDFARFNNFHKIVTTGPTAQPTDPKGMPATYKGDDGRILADFIPYGDLRRAIEATEPTLWVFEDITNADPDVQKALMQLIHERRVGDNILSEYVHIVATGNRREDKSGVKATIEPFKTRFGFVVEIIPSVDTYLPWALANGVHEDVIGFLRFSPENLYIHAPSNDMNRQPNLRMWQYLSDTLIELDSADYEPDEMTYNMSIKATCGVGLGTNMIDFRTYKKMLPDADDCLANPDTCRLPDRSDLGIIWAFNAMMARKATVTNIQRVIKIADRMHKEHGVKLVYDAIAACPEAAETSAYLEWCGRVHSGIVSAGVDPLNGLN